MSAPRLEGAACAELEPDEADRLFYPRTGGGYPQRVAEALALCASCPVRIECALSALREEAQEDSLTGVHGIRGGLTADQRRVFLSTRRNAQEADVST